MNSQKIAVSIAAGLIGALCAIGCEEMYGDEDEVIELEAEDISSSPVQPTLHIESIKNLERNEEDDVPF